LHADGERTVTTTVEWAPQPNKLQELFGLIALICLVAKISEKIQVWLQIFFSVFNNL
jgi:hypothetical protein